MKVKELARKAMDECGDDIQAATEKLEAMARSNTKVWKGLTDHLLRAACFEACKAICRQDRRMIWTAPNYDAGGSGERVRAHGKTLMDMPLPGGKPLRDATREDLIAASEFYRKQSETMGAISDFYHSVSLRVKTKTVGETLSEAQLEQIRGKTPLREAA